MMASIDTIVLARTCMRPGRLDKAASHRAVLGQLLCDTVQSHLVIAIERIEAPATWESLLSFVSENYALLNPSDLSVTPGAAGMPLAKDDWPVTLVRIAMLFVTAGGSGQWSVHWGARDGIVAYLGCQPIWLSGEIDVCSDGITCQVRVDSVAAHFTRHGDVWLRTDARNALAAQGPIHTAVFGRDSPFDDKALTGALAPSPSPPDQMRASLSRAFAMIEGAYPEGLRWMSHVLKGVVFVDTQDGSTTSGSSSSHPGLIYVSHPIHDHHLAAQLIHECAHQYLALLHERIGLVRPDCEETYYSPFKRHHRPLYNVLLALHAAVNIRELTWRMLVTGLHSDYLVSETERLAAEIDQMHSDVRESKGWTDLGRLFVSELCEASAVEEPPHGS